MIAPDLSGLVADRDACGGECRLQYRRIAGRFLPNEQRKIAGLEFVRFHLCRDNLGKFGRFAFW